MTAAKTTAPKSPKAAANGKPAAKKAAKAALVAAPKAPRTKKDGMRAGQIRILQALSKNRSLTRVAVAEAAGKTTTGMAFNHIGPTNPAKRPETETRTGYPCLLTLGFVQVVENKVEKRADGSWILERAYCITPAGRKALAAALKGAK